MDYEDYDYYQYQTCQEILRAQLQTNQQLQKLRMQISQSNAVNQQILQNQIRDIEEREAQKFYKNRSFKVNQLINAVGNIQDPDQKAFMYIFFDEAIISNINESINALNEISDKEYCKNMLEGYTRSKNDFFSTAVLKNINELEVLKREAGYYNSLSMNIESTQRKLNDLDDLNATPPKESKFGELGTVLAFGLVGLFLFIIILVASVSWIQVVFLVLFALVVKKMAEAVQKLSESMNNHKCWTEIKQSLQNKTLELKQEFESLKAQQMNSEYVQALNALMAQYPEWNSSVESNCKLLRE